MAYLWKESEKEDDLEEEGTKQEWEEAEGGQLGIGMH